MKKNIQENKKPEEKDALKKNFIHKSMILKGIIIIYLLAFSLICIMPPWYFKDGSYTQKLEHSWIWSPPYRSGSGMRIDLERLGLELLALTALSAALLIPLSLALKRRKPEKPE